MYDEFSKENKHECELVKQVVHEETVAMAFICNSIKDRYGHILSELHDDFIKKDDKYPKDMAEAYKLLDEHSDHKGHVDSMAAGAPHLAFAQTQRKLKCHKCGLPNYTVYNCPNCNKNKNERFKKHDNGKKFKKKVRFDKSTFKKQESFAQVKGRDKGKGKNTKNSPNANMGFAQPAEITNLTIE